MIFILKKTLARYHRWQLERQYNKALDRIVFATTNNERLLADAVFDQITDRIIKFEKDMRDKNYI